MSERLDVADAIHELASEHGIVAKLDDRTILLPEPVRGAPHLAVLQALGVAADDPPVGAAAHGPAGVAAGVWQSPDLHIARWTGAVRLVTHYRFTSRGRPDDYLREDGGIPSSLKRDDWYGDNVPDDVVERFFAVGLMLDEPPFPVPQPPPPPPEPEKPAPRASTRAPTSRASTTPKPAAAPRPRKKAAPPAPKKVVPATKTCAMCNLQKHTSQFEAGSDLCVDCR